MKNLFENKKVVLVGPAPYLNGKKLGQLIDSYDIVCRINEVFPVDQQEDYGSRTDVAFLNCATVSVNDFIFKMRESAEVAMNLKGIVCPVIKAQHDWGGDVRVNCDLINVFGAASYCISKEEYQQIASGIGVEPNAGMMSIMMLLRWGVKQLFVTGMTFYSEFVGTNLPGNGYEIFYHKNHTPEMLQLKTFNPHAGHQQFAQRQYFCSILLPKYEGTIIIDSHLQKLLRIEHSNVVML